VLANDFGRITGKPEVNCFFMTILFSLGASWVFSERFGLEVGEPPFDLSYPEAIFFQPTIHPRIARLARYLAISNDSGGPCQSPRAWKLLKNMVS